MPCCQCICCFCTQVLRPWCHFELPDSDYLPAGRRNPELPGPSGVVEPLDPATKVRCSLALQLLQLCLALWSSSSGMTLFHCVAGHQLCSTT